LNNLFNLVRGWAERLALTALHVFGNADKSVLQSVKDKFNEGTKDTKQAISELKSENPNKLSDILHIEGLIKTITPMIYILFAIIAFKIYMKFKNRR
jgi:hypothetical protein